MSLVISLDMVERKHHGEENLALREMSISRLLCVPYFP